MGNTDLALSTAGLPKLRPLPIHPDKYPDRHSQLTAEEKELMQQYATAPASFMTGGRARNLLHRLQRFEAPFMDVVGLTSPMDTTVTAARRYLFTWMVRTECAFWAWPKAIWVEVIESAPGKGHPSGTRFWMLLSAYLFCNILYVGPSTAYWSMAETVLGRDLVYLEVNKLRTQLLAIGYAGDQIKEGRIRWITALCMLVNRNPLIETFSAQLLITVDELLPEIGGNGHIQGRWALLRVQIALCSLGILDEPILLDRSQQNPSHLPALWQHDTTVDPAWLAWVCAFYEQTPTYDDRRWRQACYSLLMVGRWLKRFHPEVREPAEWTEALATEYVAYTCQAKLGELLLPTNTRSDRFQKTPRQLSPRTIDGRLIFIRTFFSHLQRRVYTVNGKTQSRLHLTWLPQEVFRTPDSVLAACQPNPKDIAEDGWFKLIWAACTLTKEKLQAHSRNPQYPLAYYRASALIWVSAARRSDEIRRLQVGCVRREWAPEMRDEQGVPIEPAGELCYLRIPTNKMRGEFYVPVPAYVADAIEVWESVRPPNQGTLLDRKTRQPTQYLFQYRNDLMGERFLNKSVIPLLCELAGVSQTDVVGRITSHRARATTATWMYKMGMAPADIGKLLGHTDPLRSLPWYLREDKHRLGRAYRKANPLERYVAAILDTNAHARQEPCVFYYLADGPDGRPRMCGNPHFSRCIHQLQCIECEAFIDHEQAEAIEKREEAIIISVPIPLPDHVVAELNEQDEAGRDVMAKLTSLPPPVLPGPAFHFNKKVPMCSVSAPIEDLRARLAQVEAQIAKKQGKTDRRNASLQALLREQAELKTLIEAESSPGSAANSPESV
jgi:integrase